MAQSPIDQVFTSRLNDEQRAAATDVSNEIVTLACAGSGKSRTLAYRIAWLLACQGAEAAGIVAFTFTEKAADSIKLRVAEALSSCSLDTNLLGIMYIGTIHSYCQHLLEMTDARFRQFDVLDENKLKLYLIEKYGLIGLHRIRNQFNLPYFRTIKKISDAWVTMNEELVTPTEVAEYDELLGGILSGLGDRMIGDEFIDFSLMQRRAVEAMLRQNDLALEAVAGLQHLLVDEYQDINPVQEELIRVLHNLSESLFVVGDDDQSIYAWRGADVTRIQSFQDRYPDSSNHTLATNYRSTPLIVRVSDEFAHQELGALRIVKNPTAIERNVPNEMRVLWFNTRDHEADWVISKIRELLHTRYLEDDGRTRGLTPADFAILMRSTRKNEPNDNPPRHRAFTERLAIAGFPYALEAGGGLFDRPHVALLRSTYEMLRDGQPDRNSARQHFNNNVLSLFPNANFANFVRVLTHWGREIHTPVAQGAPRRRIYPQQLLLDLLESFEIRSTSLDNGTLQDIGVFSRIMQDVEAVYPSVDSTDRFRSILNFLSQVAADGYDTSSTEIVQRPDAVTVSTVHKMKGLEFPVVLVVDVENTRFPGKRRQYEGLLPQVVIQESVNRGAYHSTREEEARLFYTALTRAERFLYVTGCAQGPGWKRNLRQSPFSAHLQDEEIERDPDAGTPKLTPESPLRRIEESNLPTSFSDIRYYMRCPKDYQYRKVFGFSPAIPELFGFGMTVHTSVGRLHERFRDRGPSKDEAREIAEDTFHLKHVQPSTDPINRPGPYERAKERAAELVENYANDFASDFEQRRQIEARFEIPVSDAMVSGAIDLMIQQDEAGNIIDACVIDFKTLEGGEEPAANERLVWTELSLQVQLYAMAARDVLGEFIEKGHVHLLKDNQRVEVPVDDAALQAALDNIQWAVSGIISGDFPMRPTAVRLRFRPIGGPSD